MLKLNHRLKIGGGGNLLKALITDVFAGGNRLFHCGEIKLSQCHSELVSGCQAGCTAKYPLLEARDKVKCLTEQVRNIPVIASEESLSERIGEFPSPMEEERVLPFAMLAVNDIIKKCAFTLAEVLITLGIIGVVAAITIPTLSAKVQVKVLENQFKKADAMFQQSLKSSVQELGYSDINDFNIPGRNSSSSYEDLKSDVSSLNLVWLKQFSSFQNFYIDDAKRKNIRYYTLTGTPTYDYYYTMSGSRNVYILQNGVLVSDLFACSYGTNHPAGVCFIFDTNGPYKGPNRVGHDIFRYFSVYNAYPDFCNPNTKNSANTTSCYDFARKNINPKDNTSPYWNILFKPKSYWGL